jgi:hypothetical protein
MKTDPGEMECDNCLLKVRFQETSGHPSNSILGVLRFLITFSFQMHNYYFDIRKLTFSPVGLFFFLILLLGGGVELGPLGTAATDWPIVA